MATVQDIVPPANADHSDPPRPQAALDAMPRSDALPFLLTEHGRPFASAAAFGNKFADWCDAAGLEPVLCDDGKVRNYRAHGLTQSRDVHALQGGRQRR